MVIGSTTRMFARAGRQNVRYRTFLSALPFVTDCLPRSRARAADGLLARPGAARFAGLTIRGDRTCLAGDMLAVRVEFEIRGIRVVVAGRLASRNLVADAEG